MQIRIGVIPLIGLAFGLRSAWAILILWNSFVALVAAIATVSPFAPHSATLLGAGLSLLGLLASLSTRSRVGNGVSALHAMS